MLIPHTRLINMPILSLQTGAPLGRILAPIIDPRQLQVVAFYCVGPRIKGNAVLHTSDIREMSSMGMIVDGADSLMDPDGLVRLQEVINFHFTLEGQRVIDTHKKKLGKLEGFSIDIDTFYVAKLAVRQPIFRSLTGGTLLIDRSQIVEIGREKIVVAAADIHEQAPITKRPPILENPFNHRGAPQPNGSQAKLSRE